MTKDQALIHLTKYVACDFGYASEDKIFSSLCKRNNGDESCENCVFSENLDNVKEALAICLKYVSKSLPKDIKVERSGFKLKDFLE